MNRKLLRLVCVALVCINGCGRLIDTEVSRPEPKTFNEIVQELNTPEKVNQYMQSNFAYIADKRGEEFLSANITFERRGGEIVMIGQCLLILSLVFMAMMCKF